MTDIQVTIDGAHVTVSPGDRVVLRLEENPTTGFQWVPLPPGGALTLESDDFRPPGTVAPGAAGERLIAFRAAEPGTERLRVELKRAWEGRAVQTFSADVTVRDPASPG